MIQSFKSKYSNNTNFKQLINGTSSTFLISILGMCLGYISTLIISRLYGAQGVGLYNLTFNTMSLVGMICMMGMNISILRFVGEFDKKNKINKLPSLYFSILKIVLPLSLLFSFILFTFSEYIAIELLKNQLYEYAIKIVSVMLPLFVLLEISIEFIRGLNKLKVSETLRSVIRPLFIIIFLLIISIYVKNIYLPLYILGIALFVGASFALFYIIKKFNYFELEKKEDVNKKNLISTSLPMMGTSIISFFMASISLYALQYYSSIEDVGIFSIALKISLLVGLVLTVTNTVVAPKFAGLFWNRENNELQQILNETNKINILLSFLLCFLIIILSEYIMSFFGDQFREGKEILIILALAQFFNVITGSAGVLLNMCGLEKKARNIIFYSLIISLISHFILVPLYGINGAAYAFLITTIFMRLLNVYTVKKDLNLNCIYIPLNLDRKKKNEK